MPTKDVPLRGVPGRAVLAIIDRAVETRWEEAQRVAATTTGATAAEKVAAISRTYTLQLAALGGAAGGTASIPGVGTFTAIGTTTAEVGAFVFRASEMILAIGAAHGHTSGGPDQRKAWVLAVLAFGDEAAMGFAEVSAMLGGRIALQAAQGASGNWFHTVNRYLTRRLIRRWGTRKGAVLLGKLLPFGIGAAIGGSANLAMGRAVARHADRFFAQLPTGLAALPPPPLATLPPPPAAPPPPPVQVSPA